MRFSLYTAAIAAFAIAGSQAIRLQEEESFDMMSELDSIVEHEKKHEAPKAPPAPAAPAAEKKVEEKSSPAPKLDAMSSEPKGNAGDHDREKAAATIDGVRKGILALRETKVQAKMNTEDFVDNFKKIKHSDQKAACAAKKAAAAKKAEEKKAEEKNSEEKNAEEKKPQDLKGCNKDKAAEKPDESRIDQYKRIAKGGAGAEKAACKVTNDSIKSIKDASENFKSAVEALNKNTAQLAISDFQDGRGTKSTAPQPAAPQPAKTNAAIAMAAAAKQLATTAKGIDGSAKAPAPAKAPEPKKAPEPAKAPEPKKAPEPAKAPEPKKAPEPAKAPEPKKEEPAKAPEPKK